ncbi:OmpA family protein [Holophaga foetida]|uniref:OmpA family protein n=1 Tax=Holophaga foetida TaxID=35839 RepID=UPI0002473B38|nr:OmpA family protein [Holophaga foetida]
MKTTFAFTVIAMPVLLSLGCSRPRLDPAKAIQVQITSTPDKALLTMGGKTLGPTPRSLTVASTAELLELDATMEKAPAVEKRIRFLSMNTAEVTFIFGADQSAMARTLGFPRILVFDYGAGVTFELDRAELKPEFLPLLARQASLLQKSFPDIKVFVCGHTDITGNRDHNLALSVDRAKAVAEDLGARGVNRDRLKIQGFGSDYPVADNGTDQGRALNRRTEVILPQ